jgi:E3 ubiquitin-protein ligase EDD1
MYAITRRAYKEAISIFERSNSLIEELNQMASDEVKEKELLEYLYPSDSPLDHNPIYVLCCNDTCSYTWTKETHINQEWFIIVIFEKIFLVEFFFRKI